MRTSTRASVLVAIGAGGFLLGRCTTGADRSDGVPALVGGRRVDSTEGAEASPPLAHEPIATDTIAPEATRTEVVTPRSSGRDSGGAPTESTAGFDEELQRRGREGIRRGWAALRDDAVPPELLEQGVLDFVRSVDGMPEGIGSKLARQRTAEEESLALGEAAELLARMEDGKPVDPAFVRDDARFDSLFVRRSSGGTADGRAWSREHGTPPDPVEDGTTIFFPAGIHDTRLERLRSSTFGLPADLVIIGAGIDQTLLHFDDLTVVQGVRNLTLRDFTYWNSGPLLDLRGKALSTITLERVRCTGFDNGAGGSSLFNLTPTVLRAIDCIFAGGYGSDPYGGNLFDVRCDGLLARFNRCRFEHLALWHGSGRAAWRVVLADCAFDHFAAARHALDRVPAGVEFLGTTPQFSDPAPPAAGDGRRPPARDLDELFRGARERLR